MSIGTLPKHADIRKFAAAHTQFKGDAEVSEFPRILAAVADISGCLSYSLNFDRDSEGRSVVSGSIRGVLNLICERCMQLMEYPLNADFKLGVVATDDQARLLPDWLEPLLVEEYMDIADIIEDEVLLCLPIVSYHDEKSCSQQAGYVSADKSAQVTDEVRKNPFEVLAALKKK